MGKRLSIRTRLVTLMLIPAVALLALTGVQLNDTRSLASFTGQFESLVGVTGEQIALLHALQVERTRTLEALYLGADGTAMMSGEDLRSARQATEEARSQLRANVDESLIEGISDEALSTFRASQQNVDGALEFRNEIDRLSVTAAEVNTRYGQAIQSIFDFDDAIAPFLTNPELQSRQQVTAAFARMKATILDRGDTVLLATVGEIDRTSATRLVAQFASQQVLWGELIERLATDDEVARVAEVATIQPGSETARVSNGLLSNSLPPVQTQAADNRATAETLRQLEIEFASTALDTAQAQRGAANRTLLLLGLLTLAVLAFTVLVLVSVTRGVVAPLRRLTDLAHQIGVSLPGTVEEVAAGADVPESEFAKPANADLVAREDELGDLAKALRASTETAVLVATDQAQTRAGVAKTIVDVARREQSLVEQQLALLDRLEDDENNPEQLANLFGLDHLATRMRRNAENLLLFASGELPGSPNDTPTPLVDVIRGAAAEIEEYVRVDVGVTLAATVAGYASTPVSHLLAELIENATLYSPPHSRVQITARPIDGGIGIMIRDHGIGMTDDELAVARQKLAETPLLEAAESRRLGLYVVGLLSARLGIRVDLSAPAEGSGTVVDVSLPNALLLDGPGLAATTPPALAAVPPLAAGQGPSPNGLLTPFTPPPAQAPVAFDPMTFDPAAYKPDHQLPVSTDHAPPPPRLTDEDIPPVPDASEGAAPLSLAQLNDLPTRSQPPAGGHAGNGHGLLTPGGPPAEAAGNGLATRTPRTPRQGSAASAVSSLSLARESGASGMRDLDQDLLGGFFNNSGPPVAPLAAEMPVLDPEWDAEPEQAPPPVEPAPAPAPAPQTGAYTTPSWAPSGRSSRPPSGADR
ncbi:hypothetical protein BH23ACT9_BH23ACT9_04080 [soil metagenome]